MGEIPAPCPHEPGSFPCSSAKDRPPAIYPLPTGSSGSSCGVTYTRLQLWKPSFVWKQSLCLTKSCKVSCVYLPLNLWGSRVNEFPCILSYELYLWLCVFNIVYQCWKASIKINNWEFKWGCLPRSALRLCSLLWRWSYISFWSKLMLLNKNLERIIKNISFTHLWIFSWNPLNNSFDGQWIISHQECQTVQGPCMSCNCRQF